MVLVNSDKKLNKIFNRLRKKAETIRYTILHLQFCQWFLSEIKAMGHSSLNVSLTYLRGLEVAELTEEDMPMV